MLCYISVIATRFTDSYRLGLGGPRVRVRIGVRVRETQGLEFGLGFGCVVITVGSA